MEALRAAQYIHNKDDAERVEETSSKRLESSSVHTKRVLQIEQRRCLRSLESRSVHTKARCRQRREDILKP